MSQDGIKVIRQVVVFEVGFLEEGRSGVPMAEDHPIRLKELLFALPVL